MDNLKKTLALHQKWLNDEPYGLRAHLSEANLSRADLSRANLSRANLVRADLSGAGLSGAGLSWANLSGADLSRANLSVADLRGANLIGADLRGADLRWANLSGADLRGADLRWANLSWADLSRANLSRANLLCFGDMLYIRTMQFDKWEIGYTHDTLQIGCQTHPIEKWKRWDTPAGRRWISNMDEEATDWAERNLNLVLQIIEANPARKS